MPDPSTPTTPAVPQTQATTPAPDPSALSEAQLQQLLDEANGVTPPTLAAPAPAPQQVYEIKLDTGQVYRGNSWEEVARAAGKAQEEASKLIKAERDRGDQLYSLLQSREAQPQPQPASGLDKQKYYELLNEDPIAAQDYLDQVRYGIPREQLQQRLERAFEATDEFTQAREVAVFHSRHPEFSGGNEAADMVLRRMAERGEPLTATGLENAWYSLVAEGKLKPVQQTPEAAVSPAPSAPLPPPTPVTTGTSIPPQLSVTDRAEQMGDKELESLLVKIGALPGYRQNQW